MIWLEAAKQKSTIGAENRKKIFFFDKLVLKLPGQSYVFCVLITTIPATTSHLLLTKEWYCVKLVRYSNY